MPVTREDIDKNLLTPFWDSMDRHGITVDQLAKKLKSELKAKKTDTFLHQQSGEVVTAQVPDWKTRQQARKDALAYRGIIAAEKITGDLNLNHSGSVVLLPTKLSPEEWAKQQADDGSSDT